MIEQTYLADSNLTYIVDKDNFEKDCFKVAKKLGVPYADIEIPEKYRLFLRIKFGRRLVQLVSDFNSGVDEDFSITNQNINNRLLDPAEIQRIVMAEMLGFCLSTMSFRALNKHFSYLEKGKMKVQIENNKGLNVSRESFKKFIETEYDKDKSKLLDDMKEQMKDFNFDRFIKNA